MHFPEQQLMTYLRAFMPGPRLDALLDEIASAAIEADVDDEVELFALAHRLMDADVRRTDDLEAVVLVEEVGLPAEEVAYVLDVGVEDVREAVDAAWADVPADGADTTAEVQGHGAAVADEAEVTVEAAPPVEEAEVSAEVAPAEVAPPVAEAVPEEVGPPRATAPVAERAAQPSEVAHAPSRSGVFVSTTTVLAGVAVLALGALGVAVFSEAGQARLYAVGLDPLVTFLVVVGFIGGGAALLKATASPPPPPPLPPIPGSRPPTAADASDEPAAPSPR